MKKKKKKKKCKTEQRRKKGSDVRTEPPSLRVGPRVSEVKGSASGVRLVRGFGIVVVVVPVLKDQKKGPRSPFGSTE